MEAAQASRPEGMTQDSSRLWKVGVVFAVALGFVMAMLDVTVVNVALGDIQREFTSPLSTLVWIVDAYTLTLLLYCCSAIARRLDRREARLYRRSCDIRACLSAVRARPVDELHRRPAVPGRRCSVLSAELADAVDTVVSRPRHAHQDDRRLGCICWCGSGLRPFVGGLLVHQFGWRGIFYLNLPIGVLGVILTAILLRPSQPNPRPFDVASHLLMMAALSGISFTLIEGPSLGWFASRAIVLSVFVASASITLFAIRERVAPHPVIPRALLHNRRFWTLNAAGTLMSVVLFGEIFVMSLFLEKARGASAFMAGIQMLPIMGVFAFVNYYAGRASAVWTNRHIMIVGYGTAALGAASTMLVGGARLTGCSPSPSSLATWALASQAPQ